MNRKTMGALMLAAAIGIFSAARLSAGGACCAGSPEKKAEWTEKKMKKMTKQLKLDADQQAKLKAIFEQKQKAMEAPAGQMAAIHEDSCKEIGAILNDEQKKAFEKMCAKDGHGKSCAMKK